MNLGKYFFTTASTFFLILFVSCASTNVYQKSSERFYENEELKSETVSLEKDNKRVSRTKKENISAEVNGFHAEAIIESADSNSYEITTIKLYNKVGMHMGEKKLKSRNGHLLVDSGKNSENNEQAKDKKYCELVDYGDFVYIESKQRNQNFFVSKTEVTQVQYSEIMNVNPSNNVGEKFPVEKVSFFDAIEFCNRKSIKESKTPCYSMRGTTWYYDMNANGYRLLTDDEFVFVANGGLNSNNYDYSGSSSVSEVAWTKSNSGNHTHEVAKKKPNSLGIYDMSGNVWEWVWSEGADNNARGGSAMENGRYSRTSSSLDLESGKVRNDVGFRIARNATSQEKSAFSEKKKLSDKMPLYFSNAFKEISKKQKEANNNRKSQTASSNEDDDSGKIRNEIFVEQVTVKSTPNGNYIAYSILGKPFVILGSTAWNLLKCAGYAFINFAGGYNTVTKGDFFWKMPDTKAAKEKAALARKNNGIAHYPEYHKPFTDNTIEVYTFKQKTDNKFALLAENEVEVYDEQHSHYDNSISVSVSASADAASTAAVIGMVGTIITVPVSAITWVGGAAAGIYGNIAGNK